MSRTYIVWASTVLAVMGLSCSGTNESDLPLHAPGLSTPVVTGLRITTSAGPAVVATWGNPGEPVDPPVHHYNGDRQDTLVPELGGIPVSYLCAALYPNPSDGQTVLTFALPRTSRVDLWIVRARWWESPNMDVIPVLGSTVSVPSNRAIKTLIRNTDRWAGTYQVIWDGRDDNGDLVPSGFYRVYLQADNYSSWRDMFLYRSLDEIPLGLKSLVTSLTHHP